MGYDGNEFFYDNEGPRHKSYIHPFAMSQATVTNIEYMEFINSDGYSNPAHWLSEGWGWINTNKIEGPLYWSKEGDEWFEYSLLGQQPMIPHGPVTHISYFEADAYAKWAGFRLPTEQELEIFLVVETGHGASDVHSSPLVHSKAKAVSVENMSLQPNDVLDPTCQVWCWTSSQYSPYPGYKPFAGALGEYNGKFMCNQFVLKGGCVATPPGHYRHTYRNFYQPDQRWMFSGIRLAKDL